MIELVLADRCTQCNLCVSVCPTHVFDIVPDAPPRIARQADCETCFMCELYCKADALYVAPDCDHAVAVDEAALRASDQLGLFRRESGWDEWEGHPDHRNLHWRMAEMFVRAAALETEERQPAKS